MENTTAKLPHSGNALERVQAYRLAMELIPLVRTDLEAVRYSPGAREVQSQLLRAVGSIGANIAEGYSRTGVGDRRKFYEYALGSAREAEVWYTTAGITPESAARSLAILTSIRRLLLRMIQNSREDATRDRQPR
jgi:four helix bundle protein